MHLLLVLIRTRKRATKAVALAEQTGHNVRLMLSTYAHVISPKFLFVDFSNLDG
jgi:hypothetical protein